MTTTCIPSRFPQFTPRREAVIEDLTWLLSMGESPRTAAARLGYQPTSLARQLGRWGRSDRLEGWWSK